MDALTYSWMTYFKGRLDKIDATLKAIQTQEMTMANTLLDPILAAVTAEQGTVASVVTLLQQLSAALTQAIANNDPVKAQAILAEINANTTALAQAVIQNPLPPAGP